MSKELFVCLFVLLFEVGPVRKNIIICLFFKSSLNNHYLGVLLNTFGILVRHNGYLFVFEFIPFLLYRKCYLIKMSMLCVSGDSIVDSLFVGTWAILQKRNII